jgi:hypothetical protein
MSTSSYEERRSPVVYRGERVPGLYLRRNGDGSTTYELRRKVGGRLCAAPWTRPRLRMRSQRPAASPSKSRTP